MPPRDRWAGTVGRARRRPPRAAHHRGRA
jgi:hypothetical protein